MTQDEDWRSAVELTVAEFGKLNVLFNNAGIFNGGQLQRYKTEQWQQMLDVNLTGAFLGMRACRRRDHRGRRRLDHQHLLDRGAARHRRGRTATSPPSGG